MPLTISEVQEKVEIIEGMDNIIAPLYIDLDFSKHATHWPGTKGTRRITVAKLNDEDLLVAWKKLQTSDFPQRGDLDSVVIEAFRGMYTDSVTPGELEQSYAAAWRQTGQNPKDWPLEQYMVDSLVKAAKAQMQRLAWNAATVANSTKFNELYDGPLKQIETAVAASTVTERSFGTVVVREHVQSEVAAGQIFASDVVKKLVRFLPETIRKKGVKVFCSHAFYDQYCDDFENKGRTVPVVEDGTSVSVRAGGLGESVELVPQYGIPEGKLIATPAANFAYPYDDADDVSKLNFQWNFNTLYMWAEYCFGTKLVIPTDEWVAYGVYAV